jgi:hypothetical protein
MRQLGKGQSVTFFAPGEVDRRIRSLIPSDRGNGHPIRVLDILRWAMHETCDDIRNYIPHWALQGLDHHHRSSAYRQYRSSEKLKALKDAWLQPESKTLEQMYDPISNAPSTGTSFEITRIPAIRERMKLLGVTSLVDVRMAEEQEREVNYEVKGERQVERPPKVDPAQHAIRDEIRKFVITGNLPMIRMYILPLFSAIGVDKALDSMKEWSPSPLASQDFMTTIAKSGTRRLKSLKHGDYLRPVNWILSSGSGRDSVFIVISPYEANELLPIIREGNKVRLHVYAPRASASMRSFSDLTFYPIPRSPEQEWIPPAHIRTELNLFSGQLFFDSREEYEKACALLALHMAHPGAKRIEVDGFVAPKYRTGERSPFDKNKIELFRRLIELRRKGMGYGGTHVGRVLDGRPLISEFEGPNL